MNLMWLCVPVGVVWSSLLGWSWLYLLPLPPAELLAQYQLSVILVAASGVLQMFVEPVWIIGQVYMFHKLRVAMDFLWMVTRSSVLAVAVVMWPHNVVLIASVGHLGATVLYVIGYYAFFAWWFRYGEKNKKDDNEEMPFSKVGEFFPDFTSGLSEEHRGVAVSFVRQAW